ncbi:MAG: kynureninase [Myxococcales bacterium]|nr:kynureninase [Myxococcales bacterium]
MEYRVGEDFAHELDKSDPLRGLRTKFHFPCTTEGKEELLYFCGNSLGLQPVGVKSSIEQELEKWRTQAVEGHFMPPDPWFEYHTYLRDGMAAIVGALPHEVVVMNSLTVNLHLLMVSFYRPTSTRYKIVIEDGAFPSDRYAVGSQARLHGFEPSDAVLRWCPREGEDLLRLEDLQALLDREGDSIALLMLGGVHFYTGQLHDLATITKMGHAAGCRVGFDLAHAAGNVPLSLHDWGADFAAWCSYKYLNSGPGGVAGAFVHERHVGDPELVRLAGWWGNDPANRFSMEDDFVPVASADSWQLSNAPILSMAALRGSLDVFALTSMETLRRKSVLLTGYLQFLLEQMPASAYSQITPKEPEQRGAQLSIRVHTGARDLQERLQEAGVICDVRHDVIRVAPAPLYCGFHDVWRFVQILREIVL